MGTPISKNIYQQKKKKLSKKLDSLGEEILNFSIFLYAELYKTKNINNNLYFFKKFNFYYKNKNKFAKKKIKDKITLKPPTGTFNNPNIKVEGEVMQNNGTASSDLRGVLLDSPRLSTEQKLDILEGRLSLKDGQLFIYKPEVLASPPEEKSQKDKGSQPTFPNLEPLSKGEGLDEGEQELPIIIAEEVRQAGVNYAKRKISQRKWVQEHYRREKTLRDPKSKIQENCAFKKTLLKKLNLTTPNMSAKAMHEKTRRNNQRMQEDGLVTVKMRRKEDLQKISGRHKRTKEGKGRYSANSYKMTDPGFLALKLLEEHKLLYSSPQEIHFFFATGTKMDPPKKRKKNIKGGVPEHKRRSTTEGINKELNKQNVRKDTSAFASSSENKKNIFSNEEIELGKSFGKRLKEKVGRTEHPITLQLQAQTLLKHNGGDREKTKSHHERILSEHKRQQKKGILKNEGAWRQSAIDRGIELNGTLKKSHKSEKEEKLSKNTQKEKKPSQKKSKKASTPLKNPKKNPESPPQNQKNALLQEIHQAVQILPRRDEISPQMASRWLARYPDVNRVKNAIYVAYEQNQKGASIKNLEAYITALIQKEAQPQKFRPEEHEMIEKNKRFLREKVPKLRAQGIGISTSKIFREGREIYEIKCTRKKACGGFEVLEIAFYDPKLGALITDFERRDQEEKTNVPDNQEWVEEAVKTLGEENKNLKIQKNPLGYRLYLKIEQVIGEEKRKFMDHIDLKLASPKNLLEKNLQTFLEKHQLMGMQTQGAPYGN